MGPCPWEGGSRPKTDSHKKGDNRGRGGEQDQSKPGSYYFMYWWYLIGGKELEGSLGTSGLFEGGRV